MILYQNTEDEWGTLIQGIMQAEEDLNVDVNYIYLSENDTAEDQIKEVNKEIRGKSSGILMAAVNSREIQEVLENMMISIPIIFVETGAGDSFPVIRSDDYAYGKGLGGGCSSGYGTDRKPQEGNDHNRKYAEGQCEPAL